MKQKDYSFYDDVGGLERYLNLPEGTLRQIPIYARVPAVDAIIQVRDLEENSLFRPGLYYIVLVDLVGNTAFNAKYGDKEGDVRTEWFHTAVIQSIGDIDIENYVTFNKTVGDASLLIFSSFKDVYRWSQALSSNLDSLKDEYPESLKIRNVDYNIDKLDERVEDFDMKARKLIHLGEVSYQDQSDPMSLAVSQTFKIEKSFSETFLGCTQPVADAISPKLPELSLELVENVELNIPGTDKETMSYYIKPSAK